jgi:hypothetical protein
MSIHISYQNFRNIEIHIDLYDGFLHNSSMYASMKRAMRMIRGVFVRRNRQA